jgi:pimeloyl-ACP methyl ester carboxylesterase
VRFIEITYPRTLTWSLDDYAAAVENALARAGVNGGWLLGESFGSQVVWSLLGRRKFNIQGIILAGGFVRHPMRALARLGAAIAGGLPLSVLTWILFSYAKLARYRYRHAPETLADLREFVARRTVLDFQAAKHRLRLVAANDPRAIVVEVLGVPIYGLSGMLDPIVPWFRVRPWLRTHCRALRAYRVIPAADHNVLGTAPDAAAEQVLKWLDA